MEPPKALGFGLLLWELLTWRAPTVSSIPADAGLCSLFGGGHGNMAQGPAKAGRVYIRVQAREEVVELTE